ncbi:MAG: BtpA/SgcQ family protein [Bacteroidota bacterium]
MSVAFQSIFPQPKSIVGMIHLAPLPGTPAFRGSSQEVIDLAMQELSAYLEAGIDALIIENMHDVPYLKNEVGHEVSSLMSIIAYEMKRRSQLPCGIQVLAAANQAALAVAKAAHLDFIRAEGFVFGHLADEGYIDANAGALLRYRKMIGAEEIAVFTDIKKKHSSHQLTSDIDLVETAKTAAYFRADGLIITGSSTGRAADLAEIKAVKQACSLPVLVGSGINLANLEVYMEQADALIVGSWFKKEGHWANSLDTDRIKRLMEHGREIRQKANG